MNYTNGSLNEITSRNVPEAVDIMGIALATNAVRVNGNTAYRKGEYFREQLSVDNSSAALWTNITVEANGETTVTGNLFVPKTQEAFKYDADGNLTNDGRFTYTWDGENRLTNMTSLDTNPTGSKFKLDFSYDAQGRRIEKIVSTNDGSMYHPHSTNYFLYDGWNLIAVLDENLGLQSSFTWGLDLSGTIQGAGGVGGLLVVNDSANGAHFVAYDGNGDVAALVKATDGTVSANYEYGPFGEVIRATRPMAKSNPFRFSTKYQDDESDLLYYNYRFYHAATGRWLSRDSVEEDGGQNLYAYVVNSPMNRVDVLGLCDDVICGKDVTKPLNNVLKQVNSKFASWNKRNQRKACSHLMSGVQGAGVAWDILEMRQLGSTNLVGCDRQATFQGRCYFGSAINYAMFGRAIHNCHNAFPYNPKYFLDTAIAAVIWHKKHTRGGYWGNEEAMEAVPFTEYGWYYGSSTSKGPLWFHFSCAPDMRPDTRVFGWHWYPLKPKWHD